MKVSVIVPVFNVESYLSRCINSILRQTFMDFELILVDDGSTDNCSQMCDDYIIQDERVTVIHKKNKGVSVARNVGLNYAKGEYIAFADSDDYVDLNWLEIVIDSMIKTNTDCLSYNYRVVGNKVETNSSQFCTEYKNISKAEDKWSFLNNYFFSYKYGHEVWGFIFKKSIIEKHSIRFCTFCNDFLEDMGFCFKYLLYADNICGLNDVLYNYYIRYDSKMRKSENIIKVDEPNEVSFDSYSDFKKVFGQSKWKHSYSIIHYQFMNNQLSKVILSDKYPFLGEIIEKIKNKKWFRRQTRYIFYNYFRLKECFGNNKAKRILLFSKYCLHGKWKWYGIESKIAYKFFIKERS